MANTKAPIDLTAENKLPGWRGGLSACLRSSKAIVSSGNAKNEQPTESSSEEDEGEEHEVFARLIEQIDNFLNLARSQDDEWSDKLASYVNTMFTSSSQWVDSMSSKSRIAYEKLTSTKYGDITKTTQYICTVMSKVHWAAGALLVVAAVINNIQKVTHVDKECLTLLRSMHTIRVSLNRFSRLTHRPPEMDSNLRQAKDLIAKSTAWCLKILHSTRYTKYLSSGRNEREISSCRKDLDRLQSEMQFQLQIADYSERHEPSGSSHQRLMSKLRQQEEKKESDSNIAGKPEHQNTEIEQDSNIEKNKENDTPTPSQPHDTNAPDSASSKPEDLEFEGHHRMSNGNLMSA